MSGENSLKIRIDFPNDAEIDRKLDMVNQMIYWQVHDHATRAMGKIVLVRARALAPSAANNPKGNPHRKRAKTQRLDGNYDWEYPIRRALRAEFRRTNKGGYVVVGPEYPRGNKIHFLTMQKKASRGNGRARMVYWGKDSGKERIAIRNFIQQASDETRAEQKAAALAAIEKFLRDWAGA